MRKFVMVMMIVLLMTVVTSASDFCLWTLASNDMAVGRVCYALGDNIEGGFESTWRTDSGKPGQIWGLFGAYKLPNAIELESLFSNDWIPGLTATPYAGASMSIDLEPHKDGDEPKGQNRTVAGPIAGLIIEDILVLEYFYQFISDDLDEYLTDEYVLRIGLHFEF